MTIHIEVPSHPTWADGSPVLLGQSFMTGKGTEVWVVEIPNHTGYGTVTPTPPWSREVLRTFRVRLTGENR